MIIPDAVDDEAMRQVCPSTMVGWLWYCDEHDTHGNADTESEAEFLADTHTEHLAQGDDRCSTIVWQRVQHERIVDRGSGGSDGYGDGTGQHLL